MKRKIKYEFSTKVWQYSSPNGWHFVSLPISIANEIRELFKENEEGWGRLKVIAQIGESKWETAIWFDTTHKTYLLPLKAEIRKKEKIEKNKIMTTVVWI